MSSKAETSLSDEADVGDLHQFGYAQSLRRTLGPFGSFAIAFSMISITTAIFFLLPSLFGTAGAAGVWLWMPCAAGVFLIVLVYAHLAARIPITGFAYQWNSRLINPHYGWFTGYTALLAFMAGTAATAVALATVFAGDIWKSPTHGDIVLFATIAMAVAALINIISIRAVSAVNNTGVFFEIAGSVGAAALLFFGAIFFFHHDAGLPHPGLDRADLQRRPLVRLRAGRAAPPVLLHRLGRRRGPGRGDQRPPLGHPVRHDPRQLRVGRGEPVHDRRLPHRDPARHGRPARPAQEPAHLHLPEPLRRCRRPPSCRSSSSWRSSPACWPTWWSRRGWRSRCPATRCCPARRSWAAVNGTTRTPIASILLVAAVGIGINLLSAGIAANVVSICSVAYYFIYVLTVGGAIYAYRKRRMPAHRAGDFSLGRWFVPVAARGVRVRGGCHRDRAGPARGPHRSQYLLGAELVGALWYLLYLRPRIVSKSAGIYRQEVVELEKLSASSPAIR